MNAASIDVIYKKSLTYVVKNISKEVFNGHIQSFENYFNKLYDSI